MPTLRVFISTLLCSSLLLAAPRQADESLNFEPIRQQTLLDYTDRVPELAGAFLTAKSQGMDVDVEVLTDPNSSHLGRFTISEDLAEIGAFKTPTLRNIAITDPYMHDGSIATLREVVEHYNNGVVCAQCHPNAANTHPETYPKFQKQLGKVSMMWEMINWCIRNPLQGEDLAADDPVMIALQAYIAQEREGQALTPGKH